MRRCREYEKVARSWTLAFEKLPEGSTEDAEIKGFIQGAVATAMPNVAGGGASEEMVVDEVHIRENREVHYRYVNLPLAVGESIILNHALFGGLHQQAATPMTDEPFHARVLEAKIARILNDPVFEGRVGRLGALQNLADRRSAFLGLGDKMLALIPDGMPIEAILEFRTKREDELKEARRHFALMAREIKDHPWSRQFDEHVHRELVPKLEKALRPARRTWRDWLKAGGGLAAVGTATVALLGLAGTALSLPAIGTALLSIATGAKEGMDAYDALGAKPAAEAYGLHYLIRFRRSAARF